MRFLIQIVALDQADSDLVLNGRCTAEKPLAFSLALHIMYANKLYK